MPWQSVPPSSSQDTQDYAWLTQFWKAARERDWFRHGVADGRRWPKHSAHKYAGTVGSVTEAVDDEDGTVTTTMSDPSAAGWDGEGPDPFITDEDPDTNYARGPFDLVIETASDGDVNVRKVIRTPITVIDADNKTLTIGN